MLSWSWAPKEHRWVGIVDAVVAGLLLGALIPNVGRTDNYCEYNPRPGCYTDGGVQTIAEDFNNTTDYRVAQERARARVQKMESDTSTAPVENKACGDDCSDAGEEAHRRAEQDKFEGKVDPSSDCKSAAESARKACSGSEISASVAPFINTFTASMGGDQNKACRIARSIAGITTAANITLAMSCGKLKNACSSQCDVSMKNNSAAKVQAETELLQMQSLPMNPGVIARVNALKTKLNHHTRYANGDRNNLAQCQRYESNVQSAVLQSAMSAITFAQSNQCVKLTDNPPGFKPPETPECMTEKAFENENCPQWCFKPGRQTDPKCQTPVPTMPQCSDPQYAESPMCKPPGNQNPYPTVTTPTTDPFDPSGGGGGVGIGTGGSRGDTALGLNNRGIPDLPDLPPGQPPLNPVNNNGEQGGGNNGFNSGGGGGVGGGFNGSGGGGSGGVGGGEERAGAKEVFMPMSNAPAGGGEAGITTESGEGDMGPGGGLASDDASGEPPFDLSKFLPKDLQETRLPSSDAVLSANGISDANGLSNWEKVTHKMNQKRKELRP